MSKTLAEIQALDSGSWFLEEFGGAIAPSLDNTTDSVLECGLNLQLEVKEVPGLERQLVEHVVGALNRKWPLGERGLSLSPFLITLGNCKVK